ncbi:MAG: tetratricopeptide repeat protein [Gammaproteobacteria bacterium]|nr:tetratricopeptide repeat protein [Gammaproteobacteria bacterium]
MSQHLQFHLQNHFRKILSVSVLLATLPVLAQTTQNAASAVAVSNEGIAAFNQGNYQQALEFFEQAERAGDQSNSLEYNIAVSLYRLGRYEEAKERFNVLVDKPEWQVLVRYNLGLVAEAQQERAVAMQYYRLSAQQQENDRVNALAQQKLVALEQQGSAITAANTTASASAPNRWAGLISATAGQDSNASSLADDLLESASSAEDYFHELLVYGHVQLAGRQGNGFRIYGLGFHRAFNEFDHLDSLVLGIGGVYEKPVGNYLFEGGLRATTTSLDSRDVADQWQINAGLSRRFDFGTVNTSYAYSRFNAGKDFAQIDGDQHVVELGWRKQFGEFNLRSRYRYETNARDDLQRDGAFASYSPNRHGIRLEARWQATQALSTGVIAEHIHSRYDGENRLRDTDGQIRHEQRINKQSKLTADVAYRFNRHWRAKAEYQYTDQRDNFDIYAYDKHRVLGTVEFQF